MTPNDRRAKLARWYDLAGLPRPAYLRNVQAAPPRMRSHGRGGDRDAQERVRVQGG